MTIHNKLVRDRIPEIIESTGKKISTRILDEKEYIMELKKKSVEELQEYMEAADSSEAIEELADLLEVLNSLAESHGSSMEEVEKVRKDKASKGGVLKRRYI